jgi:exodeoxyribonuclease VII small subunit
MTFEDNLRRLETIVEQLDSDTVELNDALKLFEDGIALLRQASDELAVAESRVKVLIDDANGTVVTRDLDA